MNKALLISTALAAGLFAAAPAFAEMQSFKVKLDGKSETPPNDSKATATADVRIDTEAKTVTWVVNSENLSGPATAAHFHGPADPGVKAPPEVDISKVINKGSAPVTDAQIADFQAGKIYLNIHTAKFPDGEIRGQVVK